MAGQNGKELAIVLVHGGFVDGSGWEAVYKLLRKDGYQGRLQGKHCPESDNIPC